MISYKYHKKYNIVYVDFKGKIDKDALIELVIYIDKNFNIKKKLKVLLDYRNATLSFTQSLTAIEISKISELVKEKMKNFARIDTAVVAYKSDNEPYNKFYKAISKNIENYTFLVFSNFEDAENWLKNV
jgi:hypothetical protein